MKLRSTVIADLCGCGEQIQKRDVVVRDNRAQRMVLLAVLREVHKECDIQLTRL